MLICAKGHHDVEYDSEDTKCYVLLFSTSSVLSPFFCSFFN